MPILRSLLRTFSVPQAVLLVLLAPVLIAADLRVDFVGRAGGARVAGAEVCFFKAGYGPGPVAKFLDEDAFRCFPADKIIAMPPGRWAFVLRQSDKKLISTNPSILTVPAPGPPVDVFQTIVSDMIPAEMLDLSNAAGALRPDDRLALYISNQGAPYFPLLMPLDQGARSVLVPTGMPLVLLSMQHWRVLNVTDPFIVSRKARLAPPFQKLADDKGTMPPRYHRWERLSSSLPAIR